MTKKKSLNKAFKLGIIYNTIVDLIEKGRIINYGNNRIIYKGIFVNNQIKGYAKFILENGFYYIGQVINNTFHGKGKLYYPNNIFKYKGD